MSTDQSVYLFNKSWDIYKKVIDANYMHHQLFHSKIGEAIAEKSINGSIRFLDLGCGDASQLVNLFDDERIEMYTGFDLSETALLIAKDNLSFLGDRVNLANGRMEELIQHERLQYDIIHSSFAIHHLEDQEKAELIKKISEVLLPGGSFIFVDVCRKEGSDRASYINAYCQTMDQNWTKLNSDEKCSIREHLTNHDHPSMASFIKEQASLMGLTYVSDETPDGVHHFMHFQKA